MSDIFFTVKQLRGCIGIKVLHQGEPCVVIEVLESPTSIVLQNAYFSTIQTNQHGDPHRRVPQTYTIPVLTDDHAQFHPAFLALDLL